MDNETVILLVEDDASLNEANRRALEISGYTVHTALTISEARERFAAAEPDIILLDVMLPDGSGFDFCAEIRGQTQAHIIFLTAKRELEDSTHGLLSGGDDYITKPFHVREMLARVEAAMRRRVKIGIPLNSVTRGSIKIDLASNQAFVNGVDLILSQKEFSLLYQLLQNENRTVSAEKLYEKVWGQPLNNDTGALKSQIYNLRTKLEGSGYTISTKRSEGYCFERK